MTHQPLVCMPKPAHTSKLVKKNHICTCSPLQLTEYSPTAAFGRRPSCTSPEPMDVRMSPAWVSAQAQRERTSQTAANRRLHPQLHRLSWCRATRAKSVPAVYQRGLCGAGLPSICLQFAVCEDTGEPHYSACRLCLHVRSASMVYSLPIHACQHSACTQSQLLLLHL